jgi:hypothetical protein
MTPTLHRRLDDLERRAVIGAVTWRRVICATEAEANAARASVKPGEGLIVRRLVSEEVDDGRC